MKEDKELQEYSRLSCMERKAPFVEPEGYFSAFNNRLRDRLTSRKKRESTLLKPSVLLTTAALLITGIFLISRLMVTKEKAPSTEFTEAMVTACLYDMEEEQVAEVYSSMFHESPEQDQDAWLLQEMDETTLSSNL